MKYYKRYNDKFYDYDEAYNLIEKNDLENVIMRTSNRWANPSQVEVTWKMIREQQNSGEEFFCYIFIYRINICLQK